MRWTCTECQLVNAQASTTCRRCGATWPAPNPYAPPAASEPAAQKPAAKPTPASMAASVVGAIGGLVLSRYLGASLLIPLAGAFLGGFVAAKLGPARARPMVAAWATQAGHAAWMLVGGIVGDAMSTVAIDLGILAVGLVWLLARPGLAPAILLGVYQLAALALNALAFGSTDEAGTKALVTHVLLRVCALGFLAMGVITMRRQRDAG